MLNPFPSGRNQESSFLILAFLFAVLGTGIIVAFFGWCLSLFLSEKKAADSLVWFVSMRISGAPWSEAEVKGALLFVFLMLTGTGSLGFAAWKVVNYYRHYRRKKLVWKRFSSGQGTSEWGQHNELRSLMGDDGVLIGGVKKFGTLRPVRISERYSCEHFAVIGPTGCGKSSCFFMPNLLTLPNGASVIVTDPKGELQAASEKNLLARGWDVHVFAPFDPKISVGYDPLRLVRSGVEISDIADVILKNGYNPTGGQAGDTQWIGFSLPLVEAVFHAARAERGPLSTVIDAAEYVTLRTEKDRAEVMKRVGGAALDRYLAYCQSLQSPETAGSIRTVVTSALRVFQREDVVEVARKPLLPLMALRERPTALFVRIPERKADLLKPLMATFFWQFLDHVVDTPGRPIFFFLDEFPNIGKIPGFAGMAATLRSRRISLCIGLQGVEQLAREYSEYEQTDILNNMKTKIYFPGGSGGSGKYASETLGYSTVGQGEQKQRVELLSPAELRTIPDGKILVVAGNRYPVMLDAYHYGRLAGRA